MDVAGNNSNGVVALANRLRLVQIDFADHPEQARREYLGDEIKRALAAVLPQERERFLGELKEMFPTWDGNVDLPASDNKAQSQLDQREMSDPSFLVGRLIDVWPSLAESQKEAAVSELRVGGVLPSTKFDWPENTLAALLAKLSLNASTDIEPGRALELLTILAEFCCAVDQPVWVAWREVSGTGSPRRASSLQKTLGRFLMGDPDIPRGQVNQEIGKLRQLVAAFMASIPQAGKFATRHFAKFSPQEIEAMVNTEKKFGLLHGREATCWRKYAELAASIDEQSIDMEIRKSITDFAEQLMKGLNH